MDLNKTISHVLGRNARHKVAFKIFTLIIGGPLALLALNFVISVWSADGSVVEAYQNSTNVTVNKKAQFKVLLNDHTDYEDTSQIVTWNTGPISIDTKVFDADVCRLNTEAYDIAAAVYSYDHLLQSNYSVPDNEWNESVRECISPLYVLALTYPEVANTPRKTGYFWAVPVLAYADLYGRNVKDITIADYMTNASHRSLLQCGYNVRTLSQYTLTMIGRYNKAMNIPDGSGYNDLDSLGPLQILRRYLVDGSTYTIGVKEPCGYIVRDLMSWKDNVEYSFHAYTVPLCKVSDSSWLSTKEVKNIYQFVMMNGVAHNTGASYIYSTKLDSLSKAGWYNESKKIYDFTAAVTTYANIEALREFIDDWYEWYISEYDPKVHKSLAGDMSYYTSQCGMKNEFELLDKLLPETIVWEEYVMQTSGSKTGYPIKLLLDYMSLEKLYYSGQQ